MKKLYWRPQKVSRRVVAAFGLLAVCGLILVEVFKTTDPLPRYQAKTAAAQLAEQSMKAIKAERLRLGHEIDPHDDPAESGMIGEMTTPVTSVHGHLPAKQISTNPNFAAAMVGMLHEAGVQDGDCIAVGCSGSFPALNLAVYSAIEAMHLKPVVISSAASSQYGANIPDLMWIDMERVLYERGLISFRSLAASIGGLEDRGEGLTDVGRQLVFEAIDRNGLTRLASETFESAIDERMQLYDQHAGAWPIKAYINVGGGAVSVGRSKGKHLYESGLNQQASIEALSVDSVMTRFMKRGTPVIHLTNIQHLADAFGIAAVSAEPATVGVGAVYAETCYNRWLAAAVLLVLVAVLKAFILNDLGLRIISVLMRRPHPRVLAASGESATGHSELMV